ncbi:MAG: hypothetical protein KJ905_00810 [Nanoarchaeota archaeon]|nr:hypothetical protein [Nanoarchaeota archaeon]MBU1501299.1 hypothetical protein [Nanoarchaeota archaeon]MBU2459175.1 hypothetical protein [Nanoarchaeota archaeon]
MFRRNDNFPGIINCLFPDYYQAVTIEDFMSNRGKIPVPDIWRIGLLTFLPKGGVLVEFNNVDVRRKQSRNCLICDLSSEFITNYAPWHHSHHPSAGRKNIAEGRYHELSVSYFPEIDQAYLFRAEKLGPPRAKRLELKRFKEYLIPSTA